MNEPLTSEQEAILESARLVMADVGALEVLRRLFPDALTRPLYTIGDMEMHAQRVADMRGAVEVPS